MKSVYRTKYLCIFYNEIIVSVNFSGVVRRRLEKKRIVTIVTFFLGEYYKATEERLPKNNKKV